MLRNNPESPPIIQEKLHHIVDSLEKFPQDPVDNQTVQRAVQEGLLTKEQRVKLRELYTAGYNKALRACFPRDAYKHLDGTRIVSSGLEPHEQQITTEQLAREIQTMLRLPKPLDSLSVKEIYQHFLRRKIQEFPYETAVKKLSQYINECLGQNASDKDAAWLYKARDAFRVLGYLHKCRESVHYSCESEYNEMVRYGIDEKTGSFVHLRNSELTENTYDNMNKPTFVRLKDPDFSWLEAKDVHTDG